MEPTPGTADRITVPKLRSRVCSVRCTVAALRERRWWRQNQEQDDVITRADKQDAAYAFGRQDRVSERGGDGCRHPRCIMCHASL